MRRLGYPEKVAATGGGLGPKCNADCAEIKIDTRNAGNAKLAVEVFDDVWNPINVAIIEQEVGIFTCSYLPTDEGFHIVNITYGGKDIPNSPYKVKITPVPNTNHVRVTGPGICSDKVECMKPTFFEVDASRAGDGNVDVSIEPTAPEDSTKISNIGLKEGKKPDSYIVSFNIPKPGDYVITVLFAEKNVPNSPFRITVKPPPEPDVVDAKVDEPMSDFEIIWPSDASDQRETESVSELSVCGATSDEGTLGSSDVSEFSVVAPSDLSDQANDQDDFYEMSVVGQSSYSEGEENVPDTTDGKTDKTKEKPSDLPHKNQHEISIKDGPDEISYPDTDDNDRRVREWISTCATENSDDVLMKQPPPEVTGPSRKYRVVTKSGKKIKAKVQKDEDGKIVWILKEKEKKALVIDIVRAT